MSVVGDNRQLVFPDSANELSTSAIAAQNLFVISFATGNDVTGDGSVTHPLKTLAEYARRTAGITPTVVGVIEVRILDTDPSFPPAPICAYARLKSSQLLWVHGTPTQVSSGVVTAYAAESVSAATPRRLTCSTLTLNTLGLSGNRLRNTTVPRASICWATTNSAQQTAHIATITAPYATPPMTAPFVRPLTAVEWQVNDTFVIETLPILGEIQILGTQLDSDIPGGSPDPYAEADSFRIVVTDLEVSGPPPNGSVSSPTSTTALGHLGAGQIAYFGCGVGVLIEGPGASGWWSSRVDSVDIHDGVHQYYGCLFDWDFSQDGGLSVISDGYFDTIALAVFGIGNCQLNSHTGGDFTATAFMDGANFATGGVIDCRGSGHIEINEQVYGSNNPIGVKCRQGAKVFEVAATGTKPAHSLNNLRCSVHSCDLDGTLTAANATGGAFAYGVNTSTPATGASCLELSA